MAMGNGVLLIQGMVWGNYFFMPQNCIKKPDIPKKMKKT